MQSASFNGRGILAPLAKSLGAESSKIEQGLMGGGAQAQEYKVAFKMIRMPLVLEGWRVSRRKVLGQGRTWATSFACSLARNGFV